MISMRSFIDEMEKIADDGLLGEFTRTGVVSPTASTRPSHNDRTAAGRRVVRTPPPAAGGATGTGTAPNNTAHRPPSHTPEEAAAWAAHRDRVMAGYEGRKSVLDEAPRQASRQVRSRSRPLNRPRNRPQPAPQAAAPQAAAPQPTPQAAAPHTAPHAAPHVAPSAAAAEQAVSHAPGLFSRMAAGARKVAPTIARAAAHAPLAFAAGSGLAGIGGTAGVSAFRHRRRDQEQQG